MGQSSSRSSKALRKLGLAAFKDRSREKAAKDSYAEDDGDQFPADNAVAVDIEPGLELDFV